MTFTVANPQTTKITPSRVSTETWPVAYIAGTFPLPSETFVYREVRGLREIGWNIVAVSLNEPGEMTPGEKDLEQDRIIVYGSGRFETLKCAMLELCAHPLRSLATMTRALCDAMHPGEITERDLRLKLPLQAFAALGLAHQLRQRGILHIHCHFAHAPTTLGMFASKQLGIPFSFTGHANDLFQRRAFLKNKLQRAAFVACISEWHRRWYDSICRDDAARYEVIRCGVDIDAWNYSEILNTGKEGPLKLLTLCRLVEKKGVDTLIQATDLLNHRGIETELTIAGDGPDRNHLQAIAEESKFADRIHWLGPVDNSNVPALLLEADLFVLACREDANGDRDGIPVVLMEAMACGTPVVSGDLPAIRELIETGVSGVLIDGNRPEVLADKLAILWVNAPLRQALARSARNRVAKEFSLAMNLGRLQRRFTAARKS